MEPYASLQPKAHLVLPVTEDLCVRVLVLPTGQTLDSSAIERITSVLAVACAHADVVRERLSQGE